MPNQVERAFQLGSEGDDAHTLTRAVDRGKDVACVKIGRIRLRAFHLRASAGQAHRAPQTPHRLRATVLRIDEIAFEMGGQHTGCWCGAAAKRGDALENLTQSIRRTGDRGWTKRGHPMLRQTLGERGDCVTAVQRVDAVDPVHVHVDEPRHHDVAPQIDRTRCTGCTHCTRPNLSNPIAVDHERARFLDASGQHEIGAGQDDHER